VVDTSAWRESAGGTPMNSPDSFDELITFRATSAYHEV
jgi:hypothetical protein